MSELRKIPNLMLLAGRKAIRHPQDAWLYFRLAWYVVVITISARFFPLPRALSMVAASSSGDRIIHEPLTTQTLARKLDALLAIDLLCFRPSCWKRAAVLHRFLALNGISTLIRFGVKADAPGDVTGHAWLESEGLPILEMEAPNFVITYTYPSDNTASVATAALFGK
jgi:transglutaminase superfamily protein